MRTTAGTRILSMALIAFAALAARVGQADDVRSADDGWRRTARGWELTQAWTAPEDDVYRNRFIFGENLREPRPRWDFHPGLFVAAQVLFVAVAFCVWPIAARKQGSQKLGAASAPKGDENAIVPELRRKKVA